MRNMALNVSLSLLAACGGSSASNTTTGPRTGTDSTGTTATGNVVQATAGLAFSPNEITITHGDSITFKFGSVAHTVNFQQGGDSAAYYGSKSSTPGAPANIGATSNASVTRVFATAGTFEYRCTIHPNMTGEIKVK